MTLALLLETWPSLITQPLPFKTATVWQGLMQQTQIHPASGALPSCKLCKSRLRCHKRRCCDIVSTLVNSSHSFILTVCQTLPAPTKQLQRELLPTTQLHCKFRSRNSCSHIMHCLEISVTSNRYLKTTTVSRVTAKAKAITKPRLNKRSWPEIQRDICSSRRPLQITVFQITNALDFHSVLQRNKIAVASCKYRVECQSQCPETSHKLTLLRLMPRTGTKYPIHLL